MTGKGTYTTYILKCSDGTLYIGIAKDPRRRENQHNGKIPGGAKYTQGRRPVTIVYTEEYSSRSEAQKREYALKLLSTKEKHDLLKK